MACPSSDGRKTGARNRPASNNKTAMDAPQPQQKMKDFTKASRTRSFNPAPPF